MKTVSDVLAALALPVDARLDKRVPKKMLAEQGAFAAGDKRKVQDGIQDLIWVAALKPSNIAVAEYRDASREYLEIAVLSVILKSDATKARRSLALDASTSFAAVTPRCFSKLSKSSR